MTKSRIRVGAKSKRAVDSPLDCANGHEVVWDQVSELFNVGRWFADATFVYVIGEESDGPVKIGVAKDPIQRLRGMQTGNPRRLRVEYVLLGDMPIEKLLHELWQPFAVKTAAKRHADKRRKADSPARTEWFRPEIRERLFPVLETAVEKQIEYVFEAMSESSLGGMEKMIRDAHKEHDFVADGRDPVYLLGKHGGYVVKRRSRI